MTSAATQYTIGFDTALNIAVEAIDRLRDTAASHEPYFLCRVDGPRLAVLLPCTVDWQAAQRRFWCRKAPTVIKNLVDELRGAPGSWKDLHDRCGCRGG